MGIVCDFQPVENPVIESGNLLLFWKCESNYSLVKEGSLDYVDL